MDGIVSLRGREHEARVSELLAMAQVHRPAAERTDRGPIIARSYAHSTDRDLWGYERDGGLLAAAGVERRGPVIWLSEIAVLPEARRQGIGRDIVAFLRRTHPGVPIEGDTIAESTGFYSACGFDVREAGTLPSGATIVRFSLQPALGPDETRATGR